MQHGWRKFARPLAWDLYLLLPSWKLAALSSLWFSRWEALMTEGCYLYPPWSKKWWCSEKWFQQGCSRESLELGTPVTKTSWFLVNLLISRIFFSNSAGFWRKNQGIWGKKMSSSDVYKLLPYLEFGKMSGTLRWAAVERFVLHGKQVSSIFFGWKKCNWLHNLYQFIVDHLQYSYYLTIIYIYI